VLGAFLFFYPLACNQTQGCYFYDCGISVETARG